MPRKYLISLFAIVFGVIAIIFFGYCYTALDPDFGWHLQMGNIILKSGLPPTDPFTYSMPTYHYIDHEWLSDVTFAWSHSISPIGPAIIYTLIMLSALALTLHRRLAFWSLIPILLVTPILLSSGGVRPQVISWLFFALILRIIWSHQTLQRHRWWLPPIFLIWGNFHGSFPIGFGVIFLAIVVYSWQTRKIDWRSLAAWIVAILATFINPYGYQLWVQSFVESWRLSQLTLLNRGIDEWLPLWSRFSTTLALYFISSLILFVINIKKLPLLQTLLYLGLIILALSARRHLPFWLLLSIPIYAECLMLFFKLKPTPQPNQLRNLILAFVLTFSIFALHSRIVYQEALNWHEITRYPYGATIFLKQYPTEDNLFAPYTWGGYLIWKLPQKKVFIDGRMPSWIQTNAPSNQSNWAYKDFNDFVFGKIDTTEFINKYNINTVLWFQQTEKTAPFLQNLRAQGWKRIYGDPISIIYQRPKISTPSAATPESLP